MGAHVYIFGRATSIIGGAPIYMVVPRQNIDAMNEINAINAINAITSIYIYIYIYINAFICIHVSRSR